MRDLDDLLRMIKTVTYEDVVNWWQSKNITTIDDYATVLDNFRVVFACNSECIENSPISYHTTREIYENKSVTNYTGDINSIMQVQNQKLCYDWMLTNLQNRTPISEDFIKRMHKLLMRGCYDESRYNKGERAGVYKIGDYGVGLAEVGSFAEDVDEDMKFLLSQVNSVDSSDVLTIASYLHLQFEYIHPFADGNGRCGRTLMNYFLMLNNYPPIVIYNEDKETYYLALEVYDRTGKIDGFKEFLKEQTVKVWGNKVRLRG